MRIQRNRGFWLILLLAGVVFYGCGDNHMGEEKISTAGEQKVITLDQGWNEDQQSDFYNTSQGSQFMPYSWFLALEQSDNHNLFRDKINIKKLGFIPQDVKSGINPDGLPVGFVKDDHMDAVLSSALSTSRVQYDAESTRSPYAEWLGFTCAACHTSEIQYNNQVMRIDGGPPLSDFQTLIVAFSKALKATAENDQKLTRFAKNVLAEGGYNETEKRNIKEEIHTYITWLDKYIEMNYNGLSVPYGYGRLDAFGSILNRVTASFTGIEENARPANAPVSYPFLWNTSQLSWVQWNGSVNNHIDRNVGEVSGVFAHTVVNTDIVGDRFFSSAKIDNLERLELVMSELDSPKWGPLSSPLPPIDQAKAEQGKTLFAKNCMRCHGIRDGKDQFPMTAPNKFNKQFIKVTMVPIQKIGTDPLMAINFVNPALNVKPGVMQKYLPAPFQDTQTVPRAVMLSFLVKNVIAKQIAAIDPPPPEKWLEQDLSGGHVRPEKGGPNPRLDRPAYKARPLNGIWATAPYLHNGSVSSLYEMLLPAAERQKSFYVGSNKLDTKKVGFESSQEGNSFLFETVDEQGTPIPGNGNYGHTGAYHTEKKSADGQWRNYTDTERYQLIEYLKTL